LTIHESRFTGHGIRLASRSRDLRRVRIDRVRTNKPGPNRFHMDLTDRPTHREMLVPPGGVLLVRCRGVLVSREVPGLLLGEDLCSAERGARSEVWVNSKRRRAMGNLIDDQVAGGSGCSSNGKSTASAPVHCPVSTADHARARSPRLDPLPSILYPRPRLSRRRLRNRPRTCTHVRIIAVHRRVHRADLRSEARGAEAREQGGTEAEDRHGGLGGSVYGPRTGE
jgi:hypothetical protein